MDKLREKALFLGATQFGESKAKGKRFYVVYNGKKINFGLKGGSTYIDHGDDKKRDAWRARHSKIKLKTGEYAYKVKTQPEFWSYHVLW
jgi:hypothetical protein